MHKDLLNEPYDEDIAAAVERLRQAWLQYKREKAEVNRLTKKHQVSNETMPLKGFEDAFKQTMNQTLA